MNKQLIAFAGFTAIMSGLLTACAAPEDTQSEASSTTDSTGDASDPISREGIGILQIQANGEDFVRQGFVSKDGWAINFEHLYINLVEPTAYQTDPPFDPDGEGELQATAEAKLNESITVDLAEGDENADPIIVGEVSVPVGHYNALSWKMLPASDGAAAGSTLVLIGTAQKDGETIDFNIKLDPEYAYVCGEFVGDERKGVLTAGDTANIEATFHFDHIFGDGDAPTDDAINTGALGFDPFATLASGNELAVDMAMLEEQLDQTQYRLLEETVAGLGHVGEGHCLEVGSQTSP